MVGNNPALAAQLAQIQTDVANSVNGQFAAAGRDLSGDNQMAYGRGVAAGEAPVIAGQYNQDVANQFNAANALYNAGNTTAGTLSGMQQNYLANQGQGVSAAQSALDVQNYGANATLAAEAQRRGIPVQALSLLAQIGVPIAGLGIADQRHHDGNAADVWADQFSKRLRAASAIFSANSVRRRRERPAWSSEMVRSPPHGRHRSGRHAVRWHAGLRLSLQGSASLSHRPDGAGRRKDQSGHGDPNQQFSGGGLSCRDRNLPKDRRGRLMGLLNGCRSANVQCGGRRIAR